MCKDQTMLDAHKMLTPIQDGVLGFVRSIADWYFQSETIRVNVICPSSVKTELLPEEAWDAFDPLSLTSMDLIVKIVIKHFFFFFFFIIFFNLILK